MQGSWVPSLVRELRSHMLRGMATKKKNLSRGSLEKEMATHSSILAQRLSWTEEPGGLYSMGLQKVGHD